MATKKSTASGKQSVEKGTLGALQAACNVNDDEFREWMGREFPPRIAIDSHVMASFVCEFAALNFSAASEATCMIERARRAALRTSPGRSGAPGVGPCASR